MRIGVFDSGVGGLTVLRAIRDSFPNVDLVYLGDTARVPYGTRSPETVVRYSVECADFLAEKGIDLLVVACNTASSYAMDVLKERLRIPVLGVVEPGVKEAVKLTKGKVGVIGTQATIRSGTYQRLLESFGLEVFAKACPLFVPLVEEGLTEGDVVERVVEMYLSELKEAGVDTLILGCTHYPLLKGAIRNFMGDVQIVDSSEAVASALKGEVTDEGKGTTELYFTDRYQNLEKMVELIMGERMRTLPAGIGSQ